MRSALLPLARFVAAHPQGVSIVAFFAAMAALKLIFSGIITGFGHLGFIAVVVALFALAFVWERKFPGEDAQG